MIGLYCCIALLVLLPGRAPEYPGHRIAIGSGTLLIIPDTITGLTLWATRAARPGYRPSPDFVGWFEPDSVVSWVGQARRFIAAGSDESARLTAREGGLVSLLRQEDACCALAFGHPSEKQRWVIEASGREVLALLDTLELLALSSRLDPPADLTYANPTNRRTTPDRTVGPSPHFSGNSGEVWTTMTLDRLGAVIPGSQSILWATRHQLGDAVLGMLPRYQYNRKDAKTQRLVVYQRFRVRAGR